MKLLALIRKHWVTTLSLGLAVFGIILAICLYYASKESREPVFRPYEIRSQIIDKDNLSDAPLKVLDKDDKPITGDIAAVTFCFWNNGKKPIKPEHILTPLKVKLGDKDARILDVKILAQSRPLIDAKLIPDPADPQSLDLSFRILEQNDGIAAQVIYEGDPDATIYPTGDIEGVTDLTGNEGVESSIFWHKVGIWSLGIGMLLLFLIPIIVAGFFLKKATTWLNSPSHPKRWAGFLIGLALLALAGFAVCWGLLRPMSDFVDQNARGLATPPPNSIIPKTLERK